MDALFNSTEPGPSGHGQTPDPEVRWGAGRNRFDTAPRLALWVFIAGEVGALAFYLWVGRAIWFLGDEWDFLANRSANSLHDLFSAHSQHWSTLPILAYRLLWHVFGLRTYVPYLTLVVLLHLTVVALLRFIMRRSGVGPWMATMAALVFAYFGSGYFNILYGFQIGFCGSLVFGLLYLLAADHDGPFGRRDLLGMGAGLAGLMCSGVGVTMVVVVALAVAIRRGWRLAATHALPLAVAYLVWFTWIGHNGYPPAASPGQIVHFAVTALASTFSALGHGPELGILLGALLAVGGTIALQDATTTTRRHELAAPIGLLIGAVVFALVTGAGRGSPPAGLAVAPETASRYLHIIAALTIPSIALAAHSVAERWRYAAPIALAAILIGIPGNVAVAVQQGNASRSIAMHYRPYILTLPRLGVARSLSGTTHPDMYLDPVMTMDWLRAGVAQGRIPPPPVSVTPEDRATWTLELALQSTGRAAPLCRATALPALVTLNRGDTIAVTRVAAATLIESPQTVSRMRTLSGYLPGATFVAYERVTVMLRPVQGGPSVTVCRSSGA